MPKDASPIRIWLHDNMQRHAFTLVELLVVVAVVGMLTTVAVVALDSARINSRNAKRKADLIQITKALDLYYADNGSYPSTGGGWRGHCGYGDYPDTDPDSWIPGLVSGGYIAKLPDDPRCGQTNPNSKDSGCWTRTNNSYLYVSDGRDYALMAYCTPEGTLSANDAFYEPHNPQRSWRICSNPAPCVSGWY